MNGSPSIQMRVTRELLERYGSCPDGLAWLDANYPNGEELMVILNSEPVPPPEFVVWGLKYFDASDEERAAANLLIHNINSKRLFGSWNVSDSDFIVNSHDIICCQHVVSSEHITDSSEVKNSKNVKMSNHITNGTEISDSEYISRSEDVKSSSFVSDSKSILWSQFVKNSLNIEDGIYCSLCKNSSLLTVCEAMEKCYNCCMCFGLQDKDNYLFNKPSTAARVEEVRTAIMNLLNFEEPKSDVVMDSSLTNFFDTLPASIKSFIKSLPEYEGIPGASFSAFI